jgi:lipopolysaccharide/colanic/teichoic acid biosynthesis glycosyltransferase
MYIILKRLFDIFFSLFILFLTLPILLLSLILIKLESKGPVFFFQERLGLNGDVFHVFKLRTMTHIKRDFHEKILAGNIEVTKVGYYLRRFKVDELPQFINVLIGNMSIVGPRPCLKNIEHLYNQDTHYRFKVKPGVTSLAGVRGSIYLTWPEKWTYDKIYVENANFILDLRIIVKTILVVFIGEKKFLKVPTKN